MVKRARKATTPAPEPPRWRIAPPLVRILVTLGFVAATLFGLSRLGDEARRGIGPRDRYSVPFTAIQCDAPPGMTRETFLTEVRYATRAGLTLQTLDPTLKSKLTAVFAAHPWVQSVDAVDLTPPDRVSVKLTFRTPVLAIFDGDTKRAVDAKGILLATTAPTAGLSELLSPVKPPGPVGRAWPDVDVVRAASIAAEYRPKTIERMEHGWQLIQPDGKRLLVGR